MRTRRDARSPTTAAGAAIGAAALLALTSCAPEGDAPARSTPEEAPGGALSEADCRAVGRALPTSAALRAGTCRATFPRSDLRVELRGATLPPGMGLTSWAAFRSAGGDSAIVMGDLALTAGELPAVMSGLRENGLRVTAIHRHMSGESPAMSFMHYLGIGPADSLARGLAAALDRAPTALGGARKGGAGPPAAARTGEAGVVAGVGCDSLARALATEPADAATGPGYCKVSRPRSDLDVTVGGVSVPASMGIGSWFAFRETASGDSAVVTGDMALTEAQVNPALSALRRHGLEVVALHNHMLHERPRVMFFHFQARGGPSDLADGLRAGLEAARMVPGR